MAQNCNLLVHEVRKQALVGWSRSLGTGDDARLQQEQSLSARPLDREHGGFVVVCLSCLFAHHLSLSLSRCAGQYAASVRAQDLAVTHFGGEISANANNLVFPEIASSVKRVYGRAPIFARDFLTLQVSRARRWYVCLFVLICLAVRWSGGATWRWRRARWWRTAASGTPAKTLKRVSTTSACPTRADK